MATTVDASEKSESESVCCGDKCVGFWTDCRRDSGRGRISLGGKCTLFRMHLLMRLLRHLDLDENFLVVIC